MIDKIKNLLSNKVVSTIKDEFGRIVYQAIKNFFVSGVFPLTLLNTKGSKLIDYKMEGNSEQEGTPTPDNPIEVVSVGEKTKNLVNVDEMLNECLSKNDDGTYSFIRTGTGNDRFTKLIDSNIPANTKINASVKLIEYTGDTKYPLSIQFKMEDGNYEGFSFEEEYLSIPRSYSKAIVGIRLFLQGSETLGAGTRFKNLQIEEGTTATEYEPYGYKIPVVSRSKNLFNKSLEPTSTTIYTAYEELETGVKISNQTTGKGWRYSRFYIADANDFKNKTVYFNANVKLVNTPIVNAAMGYCDKDNTNGKVVSYMSISENGNYKLSMDINSEVYKDKLLVVWLYSIASDTEEATELPSYAEYNDLIISTEDTTYEPYQEPITTNIYLDEPLRKVGDYADYIDFGNKKLVRNVGKFTFNNSFSLVSTGDYYVTTYRESLAIDYKYPLMFEYLQGSTWTTKVNTIMAGNKGTIVCMLDFAEFPNSDVVNEFMNGKTVYFATTNSTEQTIDLPSIPTLEGTTVLDSTQNPSYVEVEYTNEEPKTSASLTLADGNTLLDSNGDYFNVKEV